MRVTTLGIDLAKNVFQLHGVDEHGKVVLRRTIRRGELSNFMANFPNCLIGMEACGGAHYWARKFRAMGHTVKMMSPQFVKPYRKSNKNDYNDAEAICEAVSRPNMRFVSIKEVTHQDVQCLHRVRSRLLKMRTALVNEMRGFLMEYGIVVPQRICYVRKQVPSILDDGTNELTNLSREMLKNLYDELSQWDERISVYDEKLIGVFKQNEICQRVAKIEGIGPITATAIYYALSNPGAFHSGRQFSASLGLVPRQESSGGKTVLLGINKKGDKYLRMLLVHGARAALRVMRTKEDKKSRWATKILDTRGHNKACVALANKNARQVWAILKKGEQYRAAA